MPSIYMPKQSHGDQLQEQLSMHCLYWHNNLTARIRLAGVISMLVTKVRYHQAGKEYSIDTTFKT